MSDKLFPNDAAMKPMMILPPEALSEEDMQRLRDNNVCVVVAKDPGKLVWMDPIPSVASRGKIEQAAIKLSRKVMSRDYWTHPDTRKSVCETYVELLVAGTELDPRGTEEERLQRIFSEEKADEVRKLAREEARAERAAKKAPAKK